MTISEALVDLGKRLEDPNESFFTKTHKIHALNLGQKILCNLLNPEHLNQLETNISNISNSIQEDNRGRHYISYDSVGLTPVNNGIKSITGTIKGYTYLYKIKTSMDIASIEDNSYFNSLHDIKAGGTAVIISRKIYFFPEPETLKITYIRDPEELTTLNDLTAPINLNPGIDLVALDLAEALLWVRDKKYDRAETVQSKAYMQIGVLNKSKGIEDAS